MIYFYKSISPQNIESLQRYLHYFFTQLFNGASPNYDHAAFITHDFQEAIDEYKEQIDDNLQAVFTAYQLLSPAEKNVVQTAYNNNNNISGICSGLVKPYKYEELPVAILDSIKRLYDSTGILWKMLSAKEAYVVLKVRCGNLKKHFESFRISNYYSVCPFCGMENLLNEDDDLKNEYDHYIPKSKYPFCSINFSNLVPICDYCNKAGNKGQKDIPYEPHLLPPVQRPIYFPYETGIINHEILLSINAVNTDLKDIASWTLNINCLPAFNIQQARAWAEIYNIESRYKSKISKYSNTWKDKVISKYYFRCTKNGISFNDFKLDILNDFFDYKDLNNGIILKCFHEFLLSDPNCEGNLRGII